MVAGCLFGLALSVLASGRILLPPGGWQSQGPPFPYVSDIAVSPENDLVLYATARDASIGADGQYPSAVFRSEDGGLTWTRLATAPTGDLAWSIAIDPFAPFRLLAATQGPSGSHLYLTQDGGTTWQRTADFPGCSSPSVAFDFILPGRAYADCGQLFRSDGGVTWTNLGISIDGTVKTEANGEVYAVAIDRILRSTDHGDSWIRVRNAPAGCPFITAFAADPEDSSILYVGTGHQAFGRFDCGGLYKSVNDESMLEATSLSGQLVSDIVVDPSDRAIVYASSITGDGFFSPPGRVWRSLDAGLSWHGISRPGWGFSRLLLSGSGRLLYGSSSGGVFRRWNLGPRVLPPR